MKSTGLYDTVQTLRRLLTKPRTNSPAKTRQTFEQYMLTNHKLSDMTTGDGKEFLNELSKWPSMKSLLVYMGY